MQEETQTPSSPEVIGTAVAAMAPAAPAPAAPTVPAGTVSVEFQGFWIRLAASLIDGFILGIVYMVVFFGFGILAFGSAMANPNSTGMYTLNPIIFLVYPILMVIGFAYQWGMLLKFDGQTLGKKLLGIKVISADGNKLTFGQVVLRELVGKIASGIIFDIGYIWAGFDPQKQAWHDKIAKTFVIKAK